MYKAEVSNTLYTIYNMSDRVVSGFNLYIFSLSQVLSKFPVMQHFVFGSILSIEPVPT